jgi:hypothetical protein
MMSHEEWLHSDHTVMLVRWLEKKREEWTLGCLDSAGTGNTHHAAQYAGQVAAAKHLLSKIRERKNELEEYAELVRKTQ